MSVWNIYIHAHHWRLSYNQWGEKYTVKVWYVEANVDTCFRKIYILPSQFLFLCSSYGETQKWPAQISICARCFLQFIKWILTLESDWSNLTVTYLGKKFLAVCLFWLKVRNHDDVLIIYNTHLIFVFGIVRFSLCYFCFDFHAYDWGKRKICAYLLLLWNTRVTEELS